MRKCVKCDSEIADITFGSDSMWVDHEGTTGHGICHVCLWDDAIAAHGDMIVAKDELKCFPGETVTQRAESFTKIYKQLTQAISVKNTSARSKIARLKLLVKQFDRVEAKRDARDNVYSLRRNV